LIPAYLAQSHDPARFLAEIGPESARFSGCNLLLSDGDSLCYGSNRADTFARTLAPGIYGLSNHLLDTPWPKLLRVRERFSELLRTSESLTDDLFEILADRTQSPPDAHTPPSRLSPELQKALSAPFVLHPSYGTRCSTVLLQEPGGAMHIAERGFDRAGTPSHFVTFDVPAPAV
jgi:uncharacterized protein with NRDE domain